MCISALSPWPCSRVCGPAPQQIAEHRSAQPRPSVLCTLLACTAQPAMVQMHRQPQLSCVKAKQWRTSAHMYRHRLAAYQSGPHERSMALSSVKPFRTASSTHGMSRVNIDPHTELLCNLTATNWQADSAANRNASADVRRPMTCARQIPELHNTSAAA